MQPEPLRPPLRLRRRLTDPSRDGPAGATLENGSSIGERAMAARWSRHARMAIWTLLSAFGRFPARAQKQPLDTTSSRIREAEGESTEPTLLLIGQPMDASGFNTLPGARPLAAMGTRRSTGSPRRAHTFTIIRARQSGHPFSETGEAGSRNTASLHSPMPMRRTS
jgi:hypothetical protein